MANLGRTKIPVKKLNKDTPATVRARGYVPEQSYWQLEAKNGCNRNCSLTPEKVKVALFQIFFNGRLVRQDLWAKLH